MFFLVGDEVVLRGYKTLICFFDLYVSNTIKIITIKYVERCGREKKRKTNGIQHKDVY